MHQPLFLISLLFTLILVACGGPEVYREEAFQTESPYKIQLSVPVREACEAAQLALLSQGYRLELEQPQAIKARKDFQPESDITASIEFHVVCKARPTGSIMFANAVQTSYELKKSRQSTSISIPSAGALSLPFGKTTESLVKIAEETIANEDFYARYFALVMTYLEQPAKRKLSAE